MENHILDKHALPDSNNKFTCDDCTFETEDKTTFGKHYKEKHWFQATKIAKKDKLIDDKATKKLRKDYKELKNNFDRLESMYHDSLEEVNQVKSEYESKLIIANDSFTVIKTENEVLKEKVDVLFKLGRSYLNNTKNTQEEINGKEQKKDTQPKDTKHIVEEDDAEDIESLDAWTKNKMRGFKRVDPTAPPQPTPPPSRSRLPKEPPAPPRRTATDTNTTPTPAESNNDSESESRFKGKYCHFFVNSGKCPFEERTGDKCKFEHKSAPMFNFGISCTRPKCMFSHPNVNGSNSFLGPIRGFKPMMNPWQMSNPWMTIHPNQIQNQQNQPWTNQRNHVNQYQNQPWINQGNQTNQFQNQPWTNQGNQTNQ